MTNPSIKELVDDIESELVIPLLEGREIELIVEEIGDINYLYIEENSNLAAVIEPKIDTYRFTCIGHIIDVKTREKLIELIREYVI